MLYTVITTIQSPTNSVRQLAARLTGGKGHMVVAGDTKGPDSFDLSDVTGFDVSQLTFLSIQDQLNSGFKLAQLLPTKHYSRKNIAYLLAVQRNASCIYETDDDNGPLESWAPRLEFVSNVATIQSENPQRPSWINVYRHFTDELIWPRGLPLDQIHTTAVEKDPASQTIWAPIQQGLADGSPDVDAIWRLTLDHEFGFENRSSVLLPAGQWCPFNTQTTWWWPVVYPLLYVPSYCSFRMCDIWKSFVAQRCLWELGTGVVFHASEVWQERNVHNLMRDFNDEVPGYQQNNRIAEILESVPLKPGVENVSANLLQSYSHLVDAEIFPAKELELLTAWIEAIAQFQTTNPKN